MCHNHTEQNDPAIQPLTLPADFTNRMQMLLGDEYEAFLDGYQKENYRALRFNARKKGLTTEDETKILAELQIPEVPVPWAEHGWYYPEEARPGRHPYHEMGIYYIQEPSAMSAASLLKPQPGERVLDLCAAPGGKSTQLASMLGSEGLMIMNEIIPNRCRILAQNVERMGIDNALVTNEDGAALAEHFPEYFHRILVDAPCSGEGMFRKNPQAMEEWSLENVQICADRQDEVLGYAARMLMPGGRLVYSTCTFAPAENEQAMQRFLTAHPEFSIEKVDAPWFTPARPEWADGNPALAVTVRLWPQRLHGEGHYVAVVRKEGVLPDLSMMTASEEETKPSKKNKKGKKGDKGKNNNTSRCMDKNELAILEEFLRESISQEMQEYLANGEWVRFGDQLYRVPKGSPSLQGLRVLRAGLHVGTFLKNRFEPSHALALAMGKEDAVLTVDLSIQDPAVLRYLMGESLPGPSGKGWCLVMADGRSMGWGKLAGGQVKNHFPKGLRWNTKM